MSFVWNELPPLLEWLECTARFDDREFIDLRKSLPQLKCDWITMIEEHGSLRAGMAALTARLRRG